MNDDRFFSALARRAVLASGLSMALLGLAGSASAQDGGTIRMTVPFGAGTTTDTIGRIVAEALGKNLHANVVVESRAGAGGVTGSDIVAKWTPDGKTVVMGTLGRQPHAAPSRPCAARAALRRQDDPRALQSSRGGHDDRDAAAAPLHALTP